MRIELHAHSDYSNAPYLDSVNRVKDLVWENIKLGNRGCAITDHEIVAGHVKFIEEAERARKWGAKKLLEDPNNEMAKVASEFRWILGNEIYLTKEGQSNETHIQGDKFYHFILLAKNRRGWEQINELSTRAWRRGYYRAIPRRPTYISDLQEIIGSEPGNVIATSACLGSYLGNIVKQTSEGSDRTEKMVGFTNLMNEIFGKGNFFLELQPGQSQEQINYNKILVKLGDYLSTPLIASCDAHYPRPSWKSIHHAYLNSQEAERETADFYDYTYFMSKEEVVQFLEPHLPGSVIEDAINNTLKIGDACEDYDIFASSKVPRTPFKDKEEWSKSIHLYDNYEWFSKFSHSVDDDKFFIYRLIKGIQAKQKKGWFDKDLTRIEQVLERTNDELKVVWEVGEKLGEKMSTYFTTFEFILEVAWELGVVGAGRGSAGAFMINFLLDITQINPLTQPAVFPIWRFLDPSKASMPDIDVDLPSSLKRKITEKLASEFSSFGATLVNISAYGTEKSKSALLTAARGLGIGSEEALYFGSLIPSDRGFLRGLHDCYHGNSEKDFQPVQDFVNEMNEHPELWEVAQRIEGLICRSSIHPAGVAIFNGEVHKQCALLVGPGGQLATQFDLNDAEKVGVLKYDLLATDAIDALQTELYLLAEDGYIDWEGTLKDTYDKYLHPEVINYDNPEMWKKACNGEIISLFQMDSPVGEQAMISIQPDTLLELAVINSVMRLTPPEGGEMPIVQYRHRKENIRIWYAEMQQAGLNSEEIALMEKHMADSRGMCITQEQLMIMLQDEKISNFSFLDSDKARKVVAKKKMEEIEALKEKFFNACQKAQTSIELANYVWNNAFAIQLGYSFN